MSVSPPETAQNSSKRYSYNDLIHLSLTLVISSRQLRMSLKCLEGLVDSACNYCLLHLLIIICKRIHHNVSQGVI